MTTTARKTIGDRLALRALLTATLVLVVLAQGGCKGTDAPPPPPPPEVSVITVEPGPVTVYDDYVGRTDAPDTIEIRSRVSGILERQAFQDGARVKPDDLLYVIDQSPYISALAQARANLAQAQANWVNAKQNLERQRLLIKKKLTSQQDYDAAVASEKASAAVVDAQQALVHQAELNLGYTRIQAPRDGTMSRSLVKPGSLINAQQTLLATLYSSDPMYVYFAISEDRLLDLQRRFKHPPGEQPESTPPFRLRLIDGSEYRFPGRLNFVDAAVDERTGTLQVRVSVPNPERFLRPGQFVRVVMSAFENKNAIRVPERAVQELQGLKSVYVLSADNKAVSRQIQVRYRVDNDWVVDKGLAPGDRVIVEGTQKVRPGSPVHPIAAKPVPFVPAASRAEAGGRRAAGGQPPAPAGVGTGG
jgi:membrane fusion protein, multidrug efflux system